MNKKKLKFSYDEQEVLCDNGYSNQLTKAVIMLDEKLTLKDIRFIQELHKIAQSLLEKQDQHEEEL